MALRYPLRGEGRCGAPGPVRRQGRVWCWEEGSGGSARCCRGGGVLAGGCRVERPSGLGVTRLGLAHSLGRCIPGQLGRGGCGGAPQVLSYGSLLPPSLPRTSGIASLHYSAVHAP
eukprot:7362994-Alexandrium_andersonii.AAC.1